MLMATITGLGICASAYYIYKNQTSISLKLIRLSLQVEDCLLKFRGNVNYYLVPNEKDHTLEYCSDISSFDFNDDDVLLRQAYDINDKNCEYYVNVIDVNKKLYCYIKHYSDKTEESLDEKKKKKGCKPAKGKKYARRVKGKCVSYGAKGYKIAPGTSKGNSYCARSYGDMKSHGKDCSGKDRSTPLCLSRKKWKCSGKYSRKGK